MKSREQVLDRINTVKEEFDKLSEEVKNSPLAINLGNVLLDRKRREIALLYWVLGEEVPPIGGCAKR
jgi:chaperonin cofactor prefoldin